MNMGKNIILNSIEIKHITKRIAYQIYETFVDDEEIIIAGISKNGYEFAKKIAEEMGKISSLQLVLCEVIIQKDNVFAPIQTSLQTSDYQNKGVILVDDVLNSGATLIYGVKHFLNVPLKKFKTAVLVDRNHKKYPVKVDFKGISLSTSLQEHVEVVFEKENDVAFLTN
jgi:pyrimidine operon attenuation protein/uracil phosphoribosyltransferase